MKPSLTRLAGVMLLWDTTTKSDFSLDLISSFTHSACRTQSDYLLVDMTRVLLDELCEAHIVSAHFTEPVEDTGFTGVEERKVLGHL